MKVAFYKGTHKGLPGLFNIAVRLWLKGPYSHCELVLDGGLSASSSGIDGGVRFKKIVFNPDKWDFVDVAFADNAETLQWFLDHYRQGYDYFGLMGFLFRPVAGKRRRWFCSEAVAAALGFEDAWRFDPCTLAAVLKARRA